jgi:hypothetical protein
VKNFGKQGKATKIKSFCQQQFGRQQNGEKHSKNKTGSVLGNKTKGDCRRLWSNFRVLTEHSKFVFGLQWRPYGFLSTTFGQLNNFNVKKRPKEDTGSC